MELVYMRDDEWVFSGANDWNDDHSPADPDAFDPMFDSIAFMGQDGVLHDAEAPAQNGARNDFFPPASGGETPANRGVPLEGFEAFDPHQSDAGESPRHRHVSAKHLHVAVLAVGTRRRGFLQQRVARGVHGALPRAHGNQPPRPPVDDLGRVPN